jgi:hypothetical protein
MSAATEVFASRKIQFIDPAIVPALESTEYWQDVDSMAEALVSGIELAVAPPQSRTGTLTLTVTGTLTKTLSASASAVGPVRSQDTDDDDDLDEDEDSDE